MRPETRTGWLLLPPAGSATVPVSAPGSSAWPPVCRPIVASPPRSVATPDDPSLSCVGGESCGKGGQRSSDLLPPGAPRYRGNPNPLPARGWQVGVSGPTPTGGYRHCGWHRLKSAAERLAGADHPVRQDCQDFGVFTRRAAASVAPVTCIRPIKLPESPPQATGIHSHNVGSVCAPYWTLSALIAVMPWTLSADSNI
jgi:hypothetical protein